MSSVDIYLQQGFSCTTRLTRGSEIRPNAQEARHPTIKRVVELVTTRLSFWLIRMAIHPLYPIPA